MSSQPSQLPPAAFDRRLWFETWAPPGSLWSPWAKPVLFAQPPVEEVIASPAPLPPRISSIRWPAPGDHLAVVIDLPGVASARLGLVAAGQGYRPVPLFNTTHGRRAVIDVLPIAKALLEDAPALAGIRLPDDAPPTFLLDADRLPRRRGSPGMFDNRWMVFPQDFPSATRLRSAGITGVLVVRERDLTPETDLRAVLRLWRRGGLSLHCVTLATPNILREPVVRASMTLGLLTAFGALGFGVRRNSAGGFGCVVPQPSQG